MNKIEIQQILVLNISILSGIFINKENLALGFLEILNVSFGNEQIANKTEMKLQTRIIFRKWKSLCWVVAVRVLEWFQGLRLHLNRGIRRVSNRSGGILTFSEQHFFVYTYK